MSTNALKFEFQEEGTLCVAALSQHNPQTDIQTIFDQISCHFACTRLKLTTEWALSNNLWVTIAQQIMASRLHSVDLSNCKIDDMKLDYFLSELQKAKSDQSRLSILKLNNNTFTNLSNLQPLAEQRTHLLRVEARRDGVSNASTKINEAGLKVLLKSNFNTYVDRLIAVAQLLVGSLASQQSFPPQIASKIYFYAGFSADTRSGCGFFVNALKFASAKKNASIQQDTSASSNSSNKSNNSPR